MGLLTQDVRYAVRTLAKGEILQGEFPTVTDEIADQKDQNAKHAHGNRQKRQA
jgi:hypothetical protein